MVIKSDQPLKVSVRLKEANTTLRRMLGSYKLSKGLLANVTPL